MNILIAGCNASLGKRLAWHIAKNGLSIASDEARHQTVSKIYLIGRKKPDWIESYKDIMQFVYTDLEHINIEKCKELIPKIDFYFHCAPIWTAEKSIDKLVEHLSIKRVFAFSSTSILSKISSTNSAEKMIVMKLINGENAFKNCPCHSTIFRPTLIYGYGEDKNVTQIAHFIKRFRFFPVAGKANGLRQPVHVDDLVKAAVLCAKNLKTIDKTYTLSGAEMLTYRQMIVKIFNFLDRKPLIITIPLTMYRILLTLKKNATVEMANRMVQDLNFDNTKAFHDFGYSPDNFKVV